MGEKRTDRVSDKVFIQIRLKSRFRKKDRKGLIKKS